MYIHFEFTSGTNPYIAFTWEKAKELKRYWTRQGAYIEKIARCMYVIHDRECLKKDLQERRAAAIAAGF